MNLSPFHEVYSKSSRELLLYRVRNEAIESSISVRGKENMGEKNDVIAPTSSMEEKVLIFYSYAYEDRMLLDRLEKHLILLKYQGVIHTWHHREISAGQEWLAEISTYLDTADIILLLVSADFLASGYLFSTELARALKRHEQRTARVIPVLLRPVDWEGAPFSKLSMLPTNAKPVTSWRQRDEAFVDIVRGIRRVVTELLNTRRPPSPAYVSPRPVARQDYPKSFPSVPFARAKILVEIDGNVISTHPLEKPVLTIGRLFGNDVQVPSQRVSRLHARIRWENGKWQIEDADSLNGIFYQGHRVDQHILSNGDRVYLAPKAALIYKQEITKPLPPVDSAISKESGSRPPEPAPPQSVPIAATPSLPAERQSKELEAYVAYYQEAIETYRQVLHTQPHEARVYYLLGNAFKALKRYQEALDSYQQALAYNSQQAEVYSGQGSILYELGRIEETLASYRQALRIAPQDAHLYWGYSIVLYTAGQRAEAISMYRQALTLDPRIHLMYQDGEHALPEPATYRRDMLEPRPSP